MSFGIRPPTTGDEPEWRALWRAYLAFYETEVADGVYAETFRRLTNPEWPGMGAFIAVAERPVGLVHYIFHPHCWQIEDVCYLQDLYVEPDHRGTGAGRALIEAVYGEADRRGCPSVYWLTQDFNHTARRLYDRVARLTPFVKYQR